MCACTEHCRRCKWGDGERMKCPHDRKGWSRAVVCASLMGAQLFCSLFASHLHMAYPSRPPSLHARPAPTPTPLFFPERILRRLSHPLDTLQELFTVASCVGWDTSEHANLWNRHCALQHSPWGCGGRGREGRGRGNIALRQAEKPVPTSGLEGVMNARVSGVR